MNDDGAERSPSGHSLEAAVAHAVDPSSAACVNGPCFVYVPVITNGVAYHKLDVGKSVADTKTSSPYWRRMEELLLTLLNRAPQLKVYPDFDYGAYPATAKTAKP